MRKVENDLSKQLLKIIIIAFIIIFVTIVVIVPKMSEPVYERGIYYNLDKALKFSEDDISNNTLVKEIAYIYIINNEIYYSSNTEDILKDSSVYDVVSDATSEKGKIRKDGNIFYYYQISHDGITKIALTNDDYIKNTKREIFKTTIPVLLFAYSVVSLLIFAWSNKLVKKIEKLKEKVDNLDNTNYLHESVLKSDDELKSLEIAIEDMRLSLKEQENLKSQMYQNISHDFKTPLTVIKSYIEAVEDGVEEKDKAFKVILEQTNKLQDKVHSLLYLNKLDYMTEQNDFELKEIKLDEILLLTVDKFKHQRKDIEISTSIDKNSKFLGTSDLWETIIDNILNNFVRYAEKEIKITVKNNKLTLYNDGPNIKEDFIESMFIPYRKGIKGEFGLGLSIVKKTLNILNYDIVVKNHNKKGVSFIIMKKETKK